MFLLGKKANQGVFIKLGAKVFLLGRKTNQSCICQDRGQGVSAGK